MIKNIFRNTLYFAIFSLPLVALAKTPTDFKDLVVNYFMPVVQGATGLVLTASTLVFFWGLVKYIFHQSSEEAKKDGKSIMTWGLLAMVISFSVIGILNFFLGNVSIQSSSTDTFKQQCPIPITDPTSGSRTTTWADCPAQ